MLKIIHISDFHLETDKPTVKKTKLIDAFIKDLNGLITDKNSAILVISGDLIDKGGSAFTNVKSAFDAFENLFIKRIVEEVGIKKEHIFFVLGNHDIDRKAADKYVYDGITKEIVNTESMNQFINDHKTGYKHLEIEECFKEFEKHFYEGLEIKRQLTNFESSFEFDKIGIACLNSSWHSASEKDPLLLGAMQIDNAVEFLNQCETRIAIMHHSLEDVIDFDRENAKKSLFQNFDILLTGHKHKLDVAFATNFQGTLLTCQSNASLADFSNGDYTNGYAIIDFEKKQKIDIHYRKYLADHGKFVINTDIGEDNGTKTFLYPTEEVIRNNAIVTKILENIRNSKLENVDTHLFTHGLNLEIPSHLNELFVEPTLCDRPNADYSSKDVVYYHISDILSNDDNFVIFGSSESGKTTLLDKLFTEYVNNFNQYEYLPVLMDFQDISTNQLETFVREYFAISKDFFNNLKDQSQKIVLIIDNANFDDSDRVDKLIEFAKEYKSIKIICSVTQVANNFIPLGAVLSLPITYKAIYIHHFRTNQIKSLITKWFPEHNDKIKDRFSILIKNFRALSLPRNPLTVTLFLWIINEQEATPVNNSVLVQMVVENLLEKAHFKNIYQNKFTYQNKTRLLAFLAYYMEQNGDKDHSYRLTYPKTLEYINSYLKDKIDISAVKIVDDFQKRGILTKDASDYVSFKYNFFFRYFLALFIDYSEEFRNHVFTEENALKYFEELVYYSGLHTDCEPLLMLSQSVLSNTFDKINAEMLSDEKKIDVFFNGRPAISSLLNFDRIKTKPTEERINQAYDGELNRIPIKNSIAKRKETDEKDVSVVLKFASLIFKNLEEVDDAQKRRDAYKKIVTSTMSLLLLVHDSVIRTYLKNKSAPEDFPENINLSLFIRILPLLMQGVLSEWIGTEKTKIIIKNKIDADARNLSMSEYEKFLSIFSYADINIRNAESIFKTFLLNNKYKYIMDLGVMRSIVYYYLRSKSNDTDKFLLNLIGDLKKKIDGRINYNKSRLIQNIREGRDKARRSRGLGDAPPPSPC